MISRPRRDMPHLRESVRLGALVQPKVTPLSHPLMRQSVRVTRKDTGTLVREGVEEGSFRAATVRERFVCEAKIHSLTVAARFVTDC